MLLNEGEGVYHCFACGKSGTVRSMIRDYCELAKIPEYTLMKYVDDLVSEYSVDIAKLNKHQKFEIPKEDIEEYEKSLGKYHDIFYYNNIAPSTVINWEVGVTNEKIIFPVKDRLDNIKFFVYRWINGDRGNKYTITKGARPKVALFGENMVNVVNGTPIVVVEGVLDAMYVEQLGFNSVAIFGVYADEKQIDKIRSINPADNVAVLFDDDEAGIKGAQDVVAKLSKYFYNVTAKCLPSVRMVTVETLKQLTGGEVC